MYEFLYLNYEGTLKLYPHISQKLFFNPWQFTIECGSIIKYHKGGIHLDIGCGPRKITNAAIGVDVVDTCEPSINVLTTADNLSMFSDNSIDLISSIHSFEHFSKPKEVLTEWYRVLKIGGHIGIIVPHRNGLIPEKEILGNAPFTGHQFDYSPDMLQQLALEFGDLFKVVELDTLHNGWSVNFILEKLK